MVTFVTNESMK